MKTNALPTLTGLIFGFGLPRMFETVARTPPGDRYRNFEDILTLQPFQDFPNIWIYSVYILFPLALFFRNN